MQTQTLCRAVEIWITTSYSASVKIFYRGLSEVFIASSFCDYVQEGQVKCNHLSGIVVNHDECCHSIVNYGSPYHWLLRQHSEPIEFEGMKWQLRQRSRGKEANTHFVNKGHSIAFGCFCGRWKVRYVSEFFPFS